MLFAFFWTYGLTQFPAGRLVDRFDLKGGVRANAAIITGLAVGPALGMLVGATVVGQFGWRPFFLRLGLSCLLCLIPWAAWMPGRTYSPATASENQVSNSRYSGTAIDVGPRACDSFVSTTAFISW